MNTTTTLFDALVQYFTQLHHLGMYAGTLFAMITVLPALMHVAVLRPMEWVTSFSSLGFGLAIDYVQLTDTATLILGGLVALALLAFVIQAVRLVILADRLDNHSLAHLDRQIVALHQTRHPIGRHDRNNNR